MFQTENITLMSIRQYDPTHTLTLRNSFASAMAKRFRWLKGQINKKIIQEDFFNLKSPSINIDIEKLTEKNALVFATSADKIDDFMDWLKEQQNKGVLEITQATQFGRPLNDRWTDTYIRHSYQKGIERGRNELKKSGYEVPADTGLVAGFNQPFHADRLGALYSRTFSELEGVTAAMDQQISRVLTDGMAQGLGPVAIARAINDRVDKIGMTRAKLIAQTETIRAHHSANVQEYRNAGVLGIKLVAEFTTAGDSRVCPICRELASRNPYTLEEIEFMIPAHPRCRCVALPLDLTDVVEKDTIATRAIPTGPVTPEEIEAVEEYGRGLYDSKVGGYTSIQNFLRFDQLKTYGQTYPKQLLQSYVDNIESAILKNPVSKDLTAYRGVGEYPDWMGLKNIDDLKPGYTFIDKGFVSTTSSKQIAQNKFIEAGVGKNPAMITIKVKKGNGAFIFKEFSELDNHEKEILLNKGSKFKVTKVSTKGKTKYITMELEDSAVSEVITEVVESPVNYPKKFNEAREELVSDLSFNSDVNKYKTEDDFFIEIFGGPKEEVAKRFKSAVDDSDVYMAIDSKLLRREIIKKEGKFKNSMETGKGSFKTIGEKRAVKERWVFGIEADFDEFDEWPKYGILSSSKEMTNKGIVNYGYGNTYVKFKKANIKNRTTLTIGDSYNGNIRYTDDFTFYSTAPPVKLVEPDVRALWSQNWIDKKSPKVEYLRKAKTIDEFAVAMEYPEAQIYGKLTMDDVSEIFVSSKKEAKALLKDLKKNGYDKIKVSPAKFDDRLELIWGGDYGNKGNVLRESLSVEDIDRFGDAWLKKLEVPERLAAWEKNKSGYKVPEDMRELLDKYIAGTASTEEYRELTKLYYEKIPLKENSGLLKVGWKDYRPKKTGWTADVFNEDVLKTKYPE